LAEHWITEVADELYAEILEIADAIAQDLAPPDDAYDGREVPQGQYLAHARAMSLADPTYVQRDLDAMAPVIVTTPDGTPLRSPTGVRNFLAKWSEARPDLHAHAVLTQPPGGT
jgi:hypothetical protein